MGIDPGHARGEKASIQPQPKVKFRFVMDGVSRPRVQKFGRPYLRATLSLRPPSLQCWPQMKPVEPWGTELRAQGRGVCVEGQPTTAVNLASLFVCMRGKCVLHVISHVTMCKSLHVCVSDCRTVCLHPHVRACVYIYIYIFTCIYIVTYIYIYMFVSLSLCACMCMCISLYTYIHVF